MGKINLRSTEAAPNDVTHANVKGYLPIGEHGLIGDLHTVALVGTDGTIDWYWLPTLRRPEPVRGDPGQRARRALAHSPELVGLDDQTAVHPRHQRPNHPLP